MSNPFQLKQVYSFDVYPISVLGNNFKNVTVVGLLDQEQANKEIDTQAIHVQVYPMLPAGTPNRADGYDYVKIKFPSGETTILGLAWINVDSIKTIQNSTITAKITGVTPGDVKRVRDALVQNGFNTLEISVS